MVTGILLVIVGSLLRPVLPWWARLGAVGVLAIVVVGNDTRLFSVRLPQNGRQVPSSVIFDGGRLGALRFGFEMGTGMRTFMTSSLPHLAALTVALYAPWLYALLSGAAFGAGRAIMPLIRMASGDSEAWDRRFQVNQRPFRLLSLFAGTASVAAVALLTQLSS
jgi:hypothetical protein